MAIDEWNGRDIMVEWYERTQSLRNLASVVSLLVLVALFWFMKPEPLSPFDKAARKYAEQFTPPTATATIPTVRLSSHRGGAEWLIETPMAAEEYRAWLTAQFEHAYDVTTTENAEVTVRWKYLGDTLTLTVTRYSKEAFKARLSVIPY